MVINFNGKDHWDLKRRRKMKFIYTGKFMMKFVIKENMAIYAFTPGKWPGNWLSEMVRDLGQYKKVLDRAWGDRYLTIALPKVIALEEFKVGSTLSNFTIFIRKEEQVDTIADETLDFGDVAIIKHIDLTQISRAPLKQTQMNGMAQKGATRDEIIPQIAVSLILNI